MLTIYSKFSVFQITSNLAPKQNKHYRILLFIHVFTCFNLDCQGASLSTGLPYKKFYSLINSIDAKVANATIEDA